MPLHRIDILLYIGILAVDVVCINILIGYSLLYYYTYYSQFFCDFEKQLNMFTIKFMLFYLMATFLQKKTFLSILFALVKKKNLHPINYIKVVIT